MNTVRTVLTPSDLNGNDFEINLLTRKVSVRTTEGSTPVSNGDTVLVRQGGVIKQVPVSEFVPAPDAPIVPRLQPVLDFIASAALTGLIGNDGDAYIVTDSTNKSDLALWDGELQVWIYYSPQNGEVTTVLTGTHAGTQWKYQQTTDSWVQDFDVAPTTGVPADQPQAKNVKLMSSNMSIGKTGHLVILNRNIIGFGSDPSKLAGTGSDIEYRLAHVIPWVWNKLSAPISRSVQYVPEFVDAVRTFNLLVALDSRGKLWAATTSSSSAGLVMNPPPSSGCIVPIPFFQARSNKVVQFVAEQLANNANACLAVMDNGEVYGTGTNTHGLLGIGSTSSPPSWTKMILPAGVIAKRARICANIGYAPVSLVLTSTGDLYGCGGNTFNVLRTGSTAQINTPILVESNVKDFASNGASLWIVKNDGTLWVRGHNNEGQLGLNNTTNQTGATAQVQGIANVSRVFTYRHWYARASAAILTSTGTVMFAGSNKHVMFGNSVGTVNATIRTFTAPAFGGQGSVVDVIVGSKTMHILTSTGTVWNCGETTSRGAGKISTASAESGVWLQVSLPKPAVGIRSAYDTLGNSQDNEAHLALLVDGTLYGWGAAHGDAYTASNVLSPQLIGLSHLDNGQAPIGVSP